LASNKWYNYLKSKQLNIDSLNAMYQHYPKLKSNKKAELLSLIIPGAGLIYAGKYGEGITSFLLQTTFLATGIYLMIKHYYVTGFFIGPGIFTTFHQGSLKLADRRVNEYNLNHTYQFNDHIKNVILLLEKT
jgi:TM2 domain-containing membrane protein YozV